MKSHEISGLQAAVGRIPEDDKEQGKAEEDGSHERHLGQAQRTPNPTPGFWICRRADITARKVPRV